MSPPTDSSDRPPHRDPAPLPIQPVLHAARELGFSLCGVTTPDPSDHIGYLRAWLSEGRHGTMGWLEREESIVRRADLRRTMPEVRSVIVVADEYGDPDGGGAPPGPDRGIIARYARGRDYHRVLPRKLARLGDQISELAGRPVVARPYVDTGPILERELARRAGLGWFGRNTMLINPRHGSYLLLGTLLVDVAIEPTPAFEADHCGSCRACLDACPTEALLGRDVDGAPVLDSNRCISYLTIEHRGPIPEELRPAIGNRVFGCDVCQEVCPFVRRFAGRGDDPSYGNRGPDEPPAGVERSDPHGPHPGTAAPPLLELMAMDRDGWEAFTRGSAIRRAGYPGLRRNVAVAIGNWLGAEDGIAEEDGPVRRAAEAALRQAAECDDPLVSEHAEWALRQAEAPDPAAPDETGS